MVQHGTYICIISSSSVSGTSLDGEVCNVAEAISTHAASA